MKMQQASTMASQTDSEGDNIQDIQTLTSQVEQLGKAHSFWNNLSVWLIAASVIATALYFFAQWMTNKRGNELSEAQAALIRTKDEQLERDLKDKDVQIETVKAESSERITNVETESKEKIAQLTTEAEQAKRDRARADEQINVAQAQAADANRHTKELSLTVEQEARKRAEAERALLELQERIKPRTFTAEQRGRLVKILKDSIKGPISITCPIGDAESLSFANEINALLSAAEWPTKGIRLKAYQGNPEGEGILVLDATNPLPHAVALQRAFFEINFRIGIETKQEPGLDKDSIELVIGVKHSPLPNR